MAKEVHVIYTIAGNLPYRYKPVRWKYQNKEYYESLSAIALAKYLSSYGKEVILKILVPHSVFILDENLKRPEILSDLKELENHLIEKIKTENVRIEFEIIPSYGLYKDRNKTISLDYRAIQVYERVLYNYLIFIEDLLELVKKNGKVFIYLDTSIGSNTFLVEALEAFNSAIVFWNFYFLGEENNKGKFYILSAEPVISSPNPEDVKHFSKEPINRIAFFEKPLTWQDFENNIQGKLEIKNKQLERAVKEGIYLFNVIKYNLPLALLINPIPENEKNKIDKNKPLEVKYLSENEIFNRINNLIKLVKPKLDFSFKENEQKYLYIKLNYENIKKAENAYFTYTKIKNLTFLLMLYANLVKNLYQVPKGNTIKDLCLSFLQNYNRIDLIKYENDDSEPIKCRGVKVNKVYKPNPNIAKVFSTLAEKYGLLINTIFLDKEWINQTKKLSCFINSYFLENEVCKYFAEIEKPNNNEYYNCSPYNSDLNINPRNFLAHLGFENNITRLCKDDKGYYIEYDEKVLNKIYEFILNDFKTEEENENQSNN